LRSTLAIQEMGKVAAQPGGEGVADRPKPYGLLRRAIRRVRYRMAGRHYFPYVDDHARDRRDSTKRGGLVSGLKVAEIRAW